MVIIVTGSREADATSVFQELTAAGIENMTELWHGGARGADAAAGDWWEQNRLADDRTLPAARIFPADWKQFGRSAGARRNGEMLNAAVLHIDKFDIPFRVLAFPAHKALNRGTFDCMMRAIKLGFEVDVRPVPRAERK